MGDKTPERKGLLWWIEHENTNEAWTMKNPWAVGAIVLTILIVLCMLATFFWGLPRPVANVIVNVAFYGYWGVLLAFEIKAKHRVAACGYRVHNGILRLLMVAMSYLFSRALVGLWRSVAEGGVFCTRSRVISP